MSRKKHEQEKALAEQREQEEAEAHDQRLYEFYTRKEAKAIRVMSLISAVIGGVIAMLGSVLATYLYRRFDCRPVVNLSPVFCCDCKCGGGDKEGPSEERGERSEEQGRAVFADFPDERDSERL